MRRTSRGCPPCGWSRRTAAGVGRGAPPYRRGFCVGIPSLRLRGMRHPLDPSQNRSKPFRYVGYARPGRIALIDEAPRSKLCAMRNAESAVGWPAPGDSAVRYPMARRDRSGCPSRQGRPARLTPAVQSIWPFVAARTWPRADRRLQRDNEAHGQQSSRSTLAGVATGNRCGAREGRTESPVTAYEGLGRGPVHAESLF